MAKTKKKVEPKSDPKPDVPRTFEDGYRQGMMRAHAEMLQAAKDAKANNSALTYVGLERFAWNFHNLSKDSSL